MINAEWNRWAWDQLQIAPTGDSRAIKRAYAVKLKSTRPDEDADAFQKLRQAYDHALQLAQAALTDEQEAAPAEELTAAPAWEASPSTVMQANPASLPAAPAEAPASAPGIPLMAQAPVAEEEVLIEEDVTPALPLFEASRSPEQCWEEFLIAYDKAPNKSLHYSLADELRRYTRGDDFDNLDFANAFELEAARYCARPGALMDLLEGLTAFYRWEEDAAVLQSAQPGLAWQIFAELRARRMHGHLLSLNTDAARALLERTTPGFTLKMLDRKFTDELQHLIQHMRWNCPETITRKLNADVVAWWEQKLASKRLQVPQLLVACLLGMVVSAMLFASFRFSDVDEQIKSALGRNTYHITTWLVGQALSLALIWRLHTGDPARVQHLRQLVQSPRGTFGWIGAAALLSLPLMLMPSASSWLLLPLCLAMSAVGLYALGSAGGSLTGRGLAIIAGLFVGMLMIHTPRSDVFGPLFLPWAILLAIGGEHCYRMLDASCRHLFKLRAAWLVLSVLTVLAAMKHGYGGPLWLALLGWLLAVAGMLLSSVYARSPSVPYLCIFSYPVVSKVANDFVVSTIGDLLIPMTMLLTAMAFTVFNMLTRSVSKEPFS